MIQKVITRGINLQSELEKWKPENTDHKLSNPQTMWESFKADIKRTAKEHKKMSTHKINTKAKSLEQRQKAMLASEDLVANDAHQTEEALLVNEIVHLEQMKAKTQKEILRAHRSNHSEKLGSLWSAMSKTRNLRDPIYHLKILNSNPPQYERNTKRMAKLAWNYHEALQKEEVNRTENRETRNQKTNQILQEIPDAQKLPKPEASPMNWQANQTQTEKAIYLAKNASAPGMDGCIYKLWNKLRDKYEEATKKNTPGFDIVSTLTELFNDIQKHGVDTRTNFSLGWMCLIHKKKDPTEISNYHPITLLNTDYKLLTKVLALQLTESVQQLIHLD